MSEHHDIPIADPFGLRKSYDALAQHYFWPNMVSEVSDYVVACPTCQRNNPTPQPALKVHPLSVPSKPYQHTSLDWLSGFIADRDGNDSVLNIVDRFSKWAVVIPYSKQMSTPDLIKVLYNRVFSWIGLPECIIGDRDSRLRASQMRALRKALAIRSNLSVAYHPQTYGSTGVFNKTFLTALRGFSNAYETNWSKVSPELLYACQNTIHTSTGFTPHRLLFGWVTRDLRAPLTCRADSDLADVEELDLINRSSYSIWSSACCSSEAWAC
jgi:hypothetical protein